MDVRVTATSGPGLEEAVVTDCLPLGLTLAVPANPAASWEATGFTTAPTLRVTPDGCGAGRPELSWSLPSPMPAGAGGTITLRTRVAATTAPATLTNQATLSAAVGYLEAPVSRSAVVTVTAPPARTCAGRVVTVDLGADERPTTGPDVIWGTKGPDVIRALGGADIVCGRGGADTIFGGRGPDTLRGGAGNDRLVGGVGIDSCAGGPGVDEVRRCEPPAP